MSHSVPEAIAAANKGALVFSDPTQFDHRGMVIRVVCNLERVFAELLFAFFQSLNPKSSWGRAQKELFSETAILSSLTRMTRLAYYLGLVNEDEVHDLRIFARLRNMYAHGRERKQFYQDPIAADLLRHLRLYKNSQEVFADFDDQGIFLSCSAYLIDTFRTKMASYESNRSI